MSAIFIVRSVRTNIDIIQVHLSRDHGQPNDVWLNVTADTRADIFGNEVCEGDAREISARLIHRAGTNGKERL